MRQEKRSMYHNELKHELERNLEIIEERDDIFGDVARHTRNDEGEKQINIDVLNRDIELKDNLSNEKKVKKKLEKIYENLKINNDNLSFELDGIKTINKILKEDNYKYKQKVQEIEKELEKSEEYINIDAKIKDKAQKDHNELNILKYMHEKETEKLKDKINDKDT